MAPDPRAQLATATADPTEAGKCSCREEKEREVKCEACRRDMVLMLIDGKCVRCYESRIRADERAKVLAALEKHSEGCQGIDIYDIREVLDRLEKQR